MNLTASRKKAQEVVAGQTDCSFISAMLVVEMLSDCNVIHKISHCSEKRYISNNWDQIWIYVCLYCENNIERTRVFMTPTGKKPFDHLHSLLADYATITKRLQIMKLTRKQST